MLKLCYIHLLVLLLCMGCTTHAQPKEHANAESATNKQSTRPQSYEETLYELGAFPVNKLTKKYYDNGNPGQVYSMGRREDVHGWLSPYSIRTYSYLTLSEKRRYGIPKQPLSYKRYVSFLDVETYQRTEDPLLFAIIQFILKEFLYRKIKIENPEDFLKVYHAKMGLDNLVLWTLKGRGLSGPMVASLYQQYEDPLLLRYLPPIESGQTEYKVFLGKLLADKQIDAGLRFEAYTQLYCADKKTHLAGYKAFIIQSINQLSDWDDRYHMNEALLSIGDEESTKVVNQSLLNDPVAEVREAILHDLKEQDRVDEFIETIYQLSLGKGKKCSGVSMNRMMILEGETEISHDLREYLRWAQQKKNLKQETHIKIHSALEALTREKPNSPYEIYGDGDSFEENKKKRSVNEPART
ncbi:hypothetical protein [Gimesia aquarii]|uniref:Uncharacterized protein n=1 Tax=Gimesia aquarii TaxID=2527964 RepID=A0A517VP50_9PLAN|nr:hypothetical protein [Gimesia aquarii]QDT94795.1 hypothetical protein V144x_02260 [Gimesia aquarii]